MIRSLQATLAVRAEPWPAIERFIHDPSAWLPAPATPLRDDAWRTTLHVGVLHRGVELELGSVWSLPDAFVRQVRWIATVGREEGGQPAAYLPSFAGQFDVRATDEDQLTLTLHGHYIPPFGRIGAAIDAVALHRVARVTADTLTRDVLGRLIAEQAAPLGVTEQPQRRHVDV